jgi:hypothetical protein
VESTRSARLVLYGLAALVVFAALWAAAGRAQAASPQVICLTKLGKHPQGAYRTRPRECILHEHGAKPAGGLNVIGTSKLRWLSWGPQLAVARGRVELPGGHSAGLKLTLTKPRRACGHVVFTRARVKGKIKYNGGSYPFDHSISLDRCRPR